MTIIARCDLCGKGEVEGEAGLDGYPDLGEFDACFDCWSEDE